MFALIDCNNFYVSCERLFRPDLRAQPVIVLSNNDGCVISRSEEAKILGIKMGVPFFQVKELCKRNAVTVFSSNYTLYGDLSERVMQIIEACWPEVEIYSIDEAFLDLTSLAASVVDKFCLHIQKIILQWTGIPVSIGIGKTKTLAKLANHVAKKELKIPVFNITSETFWLKRIGVGEVWGIGKVLQVKFTQTGIVTAFDLANLSPHRIKQVFNVVLMRTVMELQGISCLGLVEDRNNKNIISSKSFGKMQTKYENLAEAISSHVAKACEKARSQNLVVQRIRVFVRSDFFRKDLKQYAKTIDYQLITPTDDSRILIKIAKECLQKIYQINIKYKKVGVILLDLMDKSQQQLYLFQQPTIDNLKKGESLMTVVDDINKRFGNCTIKFAACGFVQPWQMKRALLSPCYTTKWAELPIGVC